jgi:hypothetical protein
MFPSRRIIMSGGDSFRNEKSLAFDGTNDYVWFGQHSNTGDDITVAAWVKLTTDQASPIVTFGKMNLRLHDKTSIKFWADVSGSSTTTTIPDCLNKWIHVAVSSDDGVNNVYVDGILLETETDTTLSTSAGESYIGRYSSAYFAGNISEVAIYSSVLTSSQIKEIYNDRKPFNHKDWGGKTTLVNWWRMGDGTLDKWGGNPDASFNSFLVTDEVNPTIGNDLITNGAFASDSGWTKGSGWSISGGTASRASGESSNSAIEHAGDAITAEKTYKYSFDFNIASGNCTAYLGGTTLDSSFTGSGTNSGYVTATGGGEFSLYGLTNAEVTSIDNVKAWLIGGVAGTAVNMEKDDLVGDVP